MDARDEYGRQVQTMPESAEYGLGMTITDGMIYKFKGVAYRATLEETSSDTMACFQRLPIGQPDDEPEMFLDRNDGSLTGDTGLFLGEYSDLEPLP